MIHAEHEDLGALRGAMVKILCRTFDTGELRRFIASLPTSDEVLPELPGNGAGLAELAHAFVDTGLRHGLFDDEFIARLADERPRFREEFESLRASISGTCSHAENTIHSAFELRVKIGRLRLVIALGCAAMTLNESQVQSPPPVLPLPPQLVLPSAPLMPPPIMVQSPVVQVEPPLAPDMPVKPPSTPRPKPPPKRPPAVSFEPTISPSPAVPPEQAPQRRPLLAAREPFPRTEPSHEWVPLLPSVAPSSASESPDPLRSRKVAMSVSDTVAASRPRVVVRAVGPCLVRFTLDGFTGSDTSRFKRIVWRARWVARWRPVEFSSVAEDILLAQITEPLLAAGFSVYADVSTYELAPRACEVQFHLRGRRASVTSPG